MDNNTKLIWLFKSRLEFIFLLSLLFISFGLRSQPVTDECFELKRELDGSFCMVKNDILFFTVDGEYNTTNLDFTVYNYKRLAMSGQGVLPSVLNKGDNRFQINVMSLQQGYYVLEVINQKKEKRVLRFCKP